MTSSWPFQLDRFQLEAIESIDAGRSVLVSAPTSSGKTVVAEHAIDCALRGGSRAFYTAPIKALSNQKYRDLSQRQGVGQVGLLTGDNTLWPTAPVVVMTTEVLRNMLYAESSQVDDLAWVILDEVHFLEDPYRGAVWEEVLLNLPPEIGIVALSATVSNAEELGAWMSEVRGPTDVVVEKRRPVPLQSHYLVVERSRKRHLQRIPVLTGGKPNRNGVRYDIDARGRRGHHGSRWSGPKRREVLRELRRSDLLPAIQFIFSRAGCDDARDSLIRDGVRLNDAEEAARVDAHLSNRLRGLTETDLVVLGADEWRSGLKMGIAAHHAGLLPLFKEITEELFASGLLKIVYATETLALGVNLPARSVVIEKLTKFTGETHEMLTPGQFAQLTGRAGRRGIDEKGHALVCWTPFVPFKEVARLARSRDFLLTSAFRPTYNMLANLMASRSRPAAHDLLRRSFAEFQTRRRNSRGPDLMAEIAGMEMVLERRCLADNWSLTERGRVLTAIHNEADLLVVETLGAGLLESLTAPEVAAVISSLTYRRRGPRDVVVPEPPGLVGRRIRRIAGLADELHDVGRSTGVDVAFSTDHGLAVAIMDWVEGADLASILDGGMNAGEFVRNVRLVADLLGQVQKASEGPLAEVAGLAVAGLERGVVALAGAIAEDPGVDLSEESADSPEAA